MEYFYVKVPEGDALCSDNECSCPGRGAKIPRGTGYVYISKEVVDFRYDARTLSEVEKKVKQWESKIGGSIFFERGITCSILMCELGARKRSLDLEVASADAEYWWKTGKVPLRPTPLAR